MPETDANSPSGQRSSSALGSYDFLSLILENSPIGISVLQAPDWRYAVANEAYCRITATLGAPAAPLLGRTVGEVFPPTTAQQVTAVMEEIRRTGRPYASTEHEADLGPGREHTWWNIHDYPLFGEGGRVVAVLSLLQEVTEQVLARRRAEAESQAAQARAVEAENERRRLQAVLEALPVGVAVFDDRMTRTATNAAFEQVWGSSLPPVRSVEDFGPYRAWWADTGEPVAPEEWAAAIALRTGQAVTDQVMEIERFDGSRAWVINTAAPVRDAQGRVVGSAVAIHDITSLHQAEEKLKSQADMLDAVGRPVIATDIEGRVTLWNRAAESVYGWRREQALGRPVVELVVSEALQADGAAIVARLAAGESWSGEYTVQRRDGSVFPALITDVPLYDRQGRQVGMVGVTTDLTGQKEAQQRLRQSEQLAQARLAEIESIYESTPVGLCTVDRDLRYLRINRQLAALNGLTVEEHLGKTLREARPGLADYLEAPLRRLIETGEPVRDMQVSFPDPSFPGGARHFVQHWRPMFDAQGRVSGANIVVMEITERKRAEEEALRQAGIQAAINRILERALSAETEEELGRACLAVAQELTQSKFGYIDELGPDGTPRTIAISDPGWEACRIVNPSGHHLPSSGFRAVGLHGHGHVLRTGTSLLANDPPAHPQSAGTPPGHPPLTSFLGVPLREQGRIIGLLAVGNRQGGYGEEHQQALEALAPAIVQAVQRKRAENAARQAAAQLRELNENLKQRIVERTEQLRALAAQLVQAEEQERRRLARVLHDDLQQTLAAAMLQLNVAQRRPEDDKQRYILEALRLLGEAVQSSRSLTAELSPAILHDDGLVPALQWLGRRMHEHYGLGVAVNIDPQAAARRIPEETAVVLFHCARELLFNVYKHAGVQEARMELAFAGSDRVWLTVSDEGRGFDMAQATEHSSAGRGFGLLSVQERMVYARGQCLIESSLGRGTRIALSLPLEAREAPGLVEETQAAAPARPALGPQAAKMRLVLVDDHAIVRRGLAQLINSEADLEVVGEGGDGLEALAIVREMRPDIVVMDITMPRMDGVEATKRLIAEFPGISVIGLSMFGDAEKEKLMRQAGAVAYVAKGGPPESLIAAIRACRAG